MGPEARLSEFEKRFAARSEEGRPFWCESLFGRELLSKPKSQTQAELCPSKSLCESPVAIYFAASWSKKCMEFLPILQKFFGRYGAGRQADQAPLEIIFVSEDTNMEAFRDHYYSMPWAAIPFGEHHLRRNLASKYGVKELPALVLLDPHGEVVNPNACMDVLDDPYGAAFPWAGQPAPGMTTLALLTLGDLAGMAQQLYHAVYQKLMRRSA